jgi:hypothetical protein
VLGQIDFAPLLLLHPISTAFVALLVIGCSSERHSVKPATSREHVILKTLATRDRNAVHVALWTLEQNGVQVPQKISFDSAYSEASPKLQVIREYLQSFPESKLSALDQNLAYHWRIYSPIWIRNDWP